jgi:hypothetical protein
MVFGDAFLLTQLEKSSEQVEAQAIPIFPQTTCPYHTASSPANTEAILLPCFRLVEAKSAPLRATKSRARFTTTS